MPREAIVDLPCRVKHLLADGDLRTGSRALVNLLRAKERVELVRARPRQDGTPIEDVPVKLPRLTATGLEEVMATVGDIEGQTAHLEPLVPYCTNCPANALRRPFGCVGGLPFPIRRSVEQYVLERAASPDRLGGAMLLQSLLDLEIDGSVARAARAESKFEAMSGPVRKLPANSFGKETLTSDELFSPLFLERGKLMPWMALNILLWFDAIALDEQIPEKINDVLVLTRLSSAEKVHRARSVLGPAVTDPDVEHFRGLLRLLYVGWAFDTPVAIDC